MESNDVKYYEQIVSDQVYNVFKIIIVDKHTLQCLKASRYFDSYNIDIISQSMIDFNRIYAEIYLKGASHITKEEFDSLFADFKEQIEMFM